MSKLSKEMLSAIRDLLGKLNRSLSKDFNNPTDATSISPPTKVRKPDGNIHDTTPQISGVRGQRSNDIQGNKASGDKIAGGLEAGGKSPIA